MKLRNPITLTDADKAKVSAFFARLPSVKITVIPPPEPEAQAEEAKPKRKRLRNPLKKRQYPY